MPIQALSDDYAGIKHGNGTTDIVRLDGFYPGTTPASAGAITKYTVFDQYVVSPAWAKRTNGAVAAICTATFYLSANITYSVAPTPSPFLYAYLFKGVTAASGSTLAALGGTQLAASPQNYLGATTVSSYLVTTTGVTNPTPNWQQVNMLAPNGAATLVLNPGEVLSLVVQFDTTGATLTSAIVNARVSIDIETYTVRA